MGAVPTEEVTAGSTKRDLRTRRERLEDADREIDLPECSAPFLLHILLEIGPAVSAGIGLGPIGWRDLDAWQSCMGVRLPPWQSRLLVSLSREYVSFSRTAEQPACPAPWNDEDTETRRERVARQLKAAFSALMKGR